MGAESRSNRNAGRAAEAASGERVAGRLGPGRARPTLGGLGLLIAALLVAALVAWPKLSGGPKATPSSTSPVAEASRADPTPTTASPSATPIVDRPGVPAALHDKYWIGAHQVGQVGTTARIVLPSNEVILGADAGRVASFEIDPNAGVDEPIIGPNGVTIIVRDFRSGAALRMIDTGLYVTSGLVSGSLLFWTGFMLPIDAQDRLDAGLWVVDLANVAATPTAIIPGGEDLTAFGMPASRQAPRISASGQTLIAALVGPLAERTDVIDVPSLTVRTTFDGMGIGTTDRVALAVHQAWTMTSSTRLALFDFATGREVGQVWQDLLQSTAPFQNTDFLVYATAPGDGELFVSFPRGGDAVIAAVAEDSGQVREILIQPGQALWLSAELSSASHLVLLPDFDIASSLGTAGRAHATLLDPESGIVQTDAFTIGTP